VRLSQFAKDLRDKPRLAILAGFQPYQTPAVGTFYLFLDRLEDGPAQPACPHRVQPSQLRKRAQVRQLHQEKAEKEARRKQILAECDSLTQHLKEELLAQATQPRPSDFLSRLEDLLCQVAVIPSAQRGLLGDLSHLVVCGDGSALVSGANCYGRPTCQCRQQGLYRCACPRSDSDPTADWGYDSYREVYYFGHTFYQHLVNYGGHDLPLHINIGQASETDFTLSLKSLDRLRKTSAAHGLALKISAAVYDAGHDGRGNYEFLLAHDISPVIALNPRSGLPLASGTAQQLNAQGVPLCPANLPMRRHSATPDGRLYFNCPVKRPTHQDGKSVWPAHLAECPHHVLCQPETKMGPVVSVRTETDPRLYPQIPRDSRYYKELMKLRSGCERSNAVKKTVHHLEHRPCRSATHYLVRLYLIAVLEHAQAWLAEDRKVLGDDCGALSDPDQLQRLARRPSS